MLVASLTNNPIVPALFDYLGAPYDPANPAANAATASRLWMSNHGQINVDYPDNLLRGVYDIFGPRLGLVGESLPALDDAAQPKCRTDNPGGTVRAMLKRIRLYVRLIELGYQPGELLCWAGQRLRELDKGETVTELTQLIMREAPVLLDHPWVIAELALDDTDADRYRRPFATETHILTLCTFIVCGVDATLTASQIIEPDRMLHGPDDWPFKVPGRTVHHLTFEYPNLPKITIFNGAAVERRDGKGSWLEPRPTTASTAAEVAQVWGFAGLHGLMVSNPHSLRLATQIDRIVRSLGHNPSFEVYGLPGADIVDDAVLIRAAKTILGEVARTLTEELKG